MPPTFEELPGSSLPNLSSSKKGSEPVKEIHDNVVDLEQTSLDTFKAEANDYFKRTSEVFKRVQTCDGTLESLVALKNFLSNADLCCIRTEHNNKPAKYPRTLMQYAMGSDKVCPEVVELLNGMTEELAEPVIIKSFHKQFLYNCTTGNIQAVERIRKVMGERFDVSVIDPTTKMNALFIAINCKTSPYFVKHLSIIPNASKLFEYTFDGKDVYTAAINSPLDKHNIGEYLSLLDIIITSPFLPSNAPLEKMMDSYFEKKATFNESAKKVYSQCFHNLEMSLMIDGIEKYWEKCEQPLTIAKLCYDRLKSETNKEKPKSLAQIYDNNDLGFSSFVSDK